MRRITQKMLREERLALRRLEDDWSRLNRPHVNRDLRSSMFTKLLELRANLQAMEARAAVQDAAGTKA